ncbi:hypothetical protein [Wocania ichthyoenteri]|uniref:hypothetical protein n=1 Tax=Wocania ichthyoenteri TaxID=1230531 RepID=UPI00053E2920|nr:hypothetical protein [Wocania ichthyoenteri]
MKLRNINLKATYKGLILFIISLFVVSLSLKTGMFWDNVLFGSEMGNPLFQNGIFKWNSIPLNSDAGHPPFLATLLATGWTLFGKSLTTSHLIMFPFVFGLLWQLSCFVDFFVKEKTLKIWTFILVISDPTLLSQFVLVNPEIIQLFFFFLALNAILRNNIYLKIIGLAFLGIVTYRGMMLCGGIFIIDVLIHTLIKKRKIITFFSKRVFLTYSIAAIPACLYLIWRIINKGWVISHPLEIWGNAWEFSSIQDFLINFGRNILVLGHQFTDFGRIILTLFILITFYIKRKQIDWKKYNYLLVIAIFSTIVIYFTSLLIKNTMGHRYYITSYLSFGLLSFLLIKEYRMKKFVYIGLLVSLLLGNLVVYSDSFAQGWDSSLAHLPYWELRKKGIEYMDENELPIKETASFFPNSTSIDNIDLNGDMRSFIKFTGKEKFVFYSNVYNLSDYNLEILDKDYSTIKSYTKRNVRVQLMKRNSNSSQHE